ncbi:MAG: tRNA pseudouridine(55) synthase TruB [Saprospiraceae bacterium]
MNNNVSLNAPVHLQDDLSDISQWHEGRLILLDKPLDWTSFDLVNKSKYALRDGLNIRKIKMGHAGTLDPKATGLMILLSGKYTKLTDYIHSFDKTYEASIFLGATTPCFDSERSVDAIYPIDHITIQSIHEAISKFTGKIIQFPPSYSAVKVGGQTAYKSAHKGKPIVTRPREVEVFDFSISRIELPNIYVTIRCSSGTYIRSIAHDLGKALGSGGYLSGLQRTTIGPWRLESGLQIHDFVKKVRSYQVNEVNT